MQKKWIATVRLPDEVHHQPLWRCQSSIIRANQAVRQLR